MNKRQKKKANKIIGTYWIKTAANGLDNLGIIMSFKKPKNIKEWEQRVTRRKDVK